MSTEKKSSQVEEGTEDLGAVAQMLSLDTLAPLPGSRSTSQRIGRGEGSGRGKTSGKGHKGQTARSGGSIPGWFEGGQMPLYRRVGKIGFRSRVSIFGKNRYALVPLSALGSFQAGSVVDPESLAAKGFVQKHSQKAGLKIVGDSRAKNSTIPEKLVVRAHAVTTSVKQAIEATGGTIELIGEAKA